MKNLYCSMTVILAGFFLTGTLVAGECSQKEYVAESESKPGLGLVYDAVVVPAVFAATRDFAVETCKILPRLLQPRSCREFYVAAGTVAVGCLATYFCGKGFVAALKKMHTLYFPQDAVINDSEAEITRLKYGMATAVHAARMMFNYRYATQVDPLYGILFAYDLYMTAKLGQKVFVYQAKPDEKASEEVEMTESSIIA